MHDFVCILSHFVMPLKVSDWQQKVLSQSQTRPETRLAAWAVKSTRITSCRKCSTQSETISVRLGRIPTGELCRQYTSRIATLSRAPHTRPTHSISAIWGTGILQKAKPSWIRIATPLPQPASSCLKLMKDQVICRPTGWGLSQASQIKAPCRIAFFGTAVFFLIDLVLYNIKNEEEEFSGSWTLFVPKDGTEIRRILNISVSPCPSPNFMPLPPKIANIFMGKIILIDKTKEKLKS